jgi:hypothetical protein
MLIILGLALIIRHLSKDLIANRAGYNEWNKTLLSFLEVDQDRLRNQIHSIQPSVTVLVQDIDQRKFFGAWYFPDKEADIWAANLKNCYVELADKYPFQ